jgi:hypothetical protein
MKNGTPDQKSHWINFRAFQWAYEQSDLSVTAKAVLITFAIHADERGYTWPGVELIAFTWGMDRETVRRQIASLLVRRLICRTKKRRGTTGQVKVYRLPKITYESGGKRHPFENDESGGKARDKRGISGGKSAPNNRIIEQRTSHDDSTTLGNSTPDPSGKAPASVPFSSPNYQNQNHPVQSNVKWAEFAAYCRSKSGQPTAKGFETWLSRQKPQWRDRVKQVPETEGYVLAGKFIAREEANQQAAANPALIEKFRHAIKRNGQIQII